MNEAIIPTLVKKAKGGQQEATYELWQLLRPLRENWARHTYLENWSKEDLEQQSYVILVEAVEKYDESLGMAFEGYYKTRLKVWKSKQSKRRSCESSNVESIERAMMNHSEGSEEWLVELERHFLLQQVVGYIKELEEDERAFLIDSVIRKMHYKELTKKHGLKESHARVKKKRILDKIKEKMKRSERNGSYRNN